MKKGRFKDIIRRHKALPAAAAAGCVLLGTAAASAAFWTDMISLDQDVSSMTVGIKYDENSLGLDSTTPYLPGDSRSFGFNVVNSGDISVDIKPVITLTASNDMVKGASEFIVTDADGTEISDYTKTYHDESGKEISKDKITTGEKFRMIRYELTNEKTLAGSMQKDSEQGETDTKAEYSYALKMSEDTGNDFKDTTASLDVSTYAIQHRNRTAGDDWVSIAAGE